MFTESTKRHARTLAKRVKNLPDRRKRREKEPHLRAASCAGLQEDRAHLREDQLVTRACFARRIAKRIVCGVKAQQEKVEVKIMENSCYKKRVRKGLKDGVKRRQGECLRLGLFALPGFVGNPVAKHIQQH